VKGKNQVCCQVGSWSRAARADARGNTRHRLLPDSLPHSQLGSTGPSPGSWVLLITLLPLLCSVNLPLPLWPGLWGLHSSLPQLGKPVMTHSQPLGCTINRPGCVTFPEGKTAAAGSPSPGILATEHGFWTRVPRGQGPRTESLDCLPWRTLRCPKVYAPLSRSPQSRLWLVAGRDRGSLGNVPGTNFANPWSLKYISPGAYSGL
jgi:hypothetical protein